ncbi:MAG: hypothetical protein ACTSYI_13280 [Promethearchaeota archaeon]
MHGFHYIQFPAKNTQKWSSIIPTLMQSWKSPYGKLSRLIFASPSHLLDFLQANENLMETESEGAPTVSLVSHPDFLYDSSSILSELQDHKIDPNIELLTQNSPSDIDNLGNVLHDILPDLPTERFPRLSLVHPEYHIDFTQKKTRKKSIYRKFPPAIKKLGKEFNVDLEGKTLGNFYFGSQVFQSFVRLFLASRKLDTKDTKDTKDTDTDTDGSSKIETTYNTDFSTHDLPLPPNPMKYYDFQENQSQWVELRVNGWFPPDDMTQILADIDERSKNKEILMFRIKFVKEAWEDEVNFKNASRDQFDLAWGNPGGDPELAFQHQNPQMLSDFQNNKASSAFYFQLTPKIHDPDFRIEILQELMRGDSDLNTDMDLVLR